MLLDVKNLLAQAKALDKDGHYQRVAKGILEQCNYNDAYLQNDSDKAEEIIIRVHEAYENYLKGIRLVSASYSAIYGEPAYKITPTIFKLLGGFWCGLAYRIFLE